MRIRQVCLALAMLMVCCTLPARAEETETSGSHAAQTLEIESQIPCFLYGGYQLSVGMRRDSFRLRASIVNSGSADFEPNGIDRRNDKFRRSYDNGSFGVAVEYFLNKYWFASVSLGSNRWLLRNEATSSTGNLRTLDAGLGTGLQYFFYRDLFVQMIGQINLRKRQSLAIEGEEYVIPRIGWSPGLRLGVRF